jgi:ribosome-associated protein
MEEQLVVEEDVVIPGNELWFTASRAGGPGGQHVNKTSSRVTLHWNLSETSALTPAQKKRAMAKLDSRLNKDGVLQIHVDDSRSQKTNLQVARDRLVGLVRSAIKAKKKRIPTKASRAAKRRRLEDKSKKSEIKRLRSKPTED